MPLIDNKPMQTTIIPSQEITLNEWARNIRKQRKAIYDKIKKLEQRENKDLFRLIQEPVSLLK